jgi:histidinol-phosphate phosphatase family protein
MDHASRAHDEPVGVIVAGGLGTRLGAATRDVPKPMLPIGGQPLLLRQIEQYRRAGITRVVILAGHLAQVIEPWARAWSDAQCRVEVVVEPRPLGSGGCLSLLPAATGPWVVAFGDVAFDMDLRALVQAHRDHAARVTAVVHPNDHPYDSDLVELDGGGRLVALHAKPHPPELVARNLVTAGVFVLDPGLVDTLPRERPLDLVHDVLAAAHARGEPIHGYQTVEYLKDMGTPARWQRVCDDWDRGKLGAARGPRPAAFLDRDGTLNRHVGHVSRPEQLELLPGVGGAVRRLNQAGVQVVVVTNQPVIARGLCDEAGLAAIHARLEQLLGREGAWIDRLYHCPHHPHRGFAGERPELKIACECRKPGPGLLQRAMRELRVDRARSSMFGDSPCDAEAAQAAHVQPVLLGEAARPEALRRGVRWYPDLPRATDAWLAEALAC